MPFTRSKRTHDAATDESIDRQQHVTPQSKRLKQTSAMPALQDTADMTVKEEAHQATPSKPAWKQLSKLPVKRRVTFSPQTGNEVKRFRTASSRQLVIKDEDTPEDPGITMTPMRTALAARLENLSQTTPESQGSAGEGQSTPRLMLFDDTMMVDASEPDSAIADMSSNAPMSSPETPSRQERHRSDLQKQYDEAVEKWKQMKGGLGREVIRARADLRKQELVQQKMDSITKRLDLETLREASWRTPDVLTKLEPEQSSDELSVTDMLQRYTTVVPGSPSRGQKLLINTDRLATLLNKLYARIDKLAERLARSETDCERTEEKRLEMVNLHDIKAEEASDLRDNLDAMLQTQQQLKRQLKKSQDHLIQTQDDNQQLRRSIDRLKESLTHYRQEEMRMQDLIARLEAEYTDRLAGQAAEIEAYREREGLASDHDVLRRKLESACHRLDEEQGLRKKAETALAKHHAEVQKLVADLKQTQAQLDRAQSAMKELTDLQTEDRCLQELAADAGDNTSEIAMLEAYLELMTEHRDVLKEAYNDARMMNEQLSRGYRSTAQQLEEVVQVLSAQRIQHAEDEASISALEKSLYELKQRSTLEAQEALAVRHDLEASVGALTATVDERMQCIARLLSEKERLVQDYNQQLSQQQDTIAELAEAPLSTADGCSVVAARDNNCGRTDQSVVASLRRRDRLLSGSIQALFASIDDGLGKVIDADGKEQAVAAEQRARFAAARDEIGASLLRASMLLHTETEHGDDEASNGSIA